jgi:hypothetical protein
MKTTTMAYLGPPDELSMIAHAAAWIEQSEYGAEIKSRVTVTYKETSLMEGREFSVSCNLPADFSGAVGHTNAHTAFSVLDSVTEVPLACTCGHQCNGCTATLQAGATSKCLNSKAERVGSVYCKEFASSPDFVSVPAGGGDTLTCCMTESLLGKDKSAVTIKLDCPGIVSVDYRIVELAWLVGPIVEPMP